MTDWQNRIVGTDIQPADWFLANPDNWKIHPLQQQQGLRAVLKNVGWVQLVMVNLRTSPDWGANANIPTLVDGHARVKEALRKGDKTPVPLVYVDLDPAEERIVLAALDPLGSFAVADGEKLQGQLDRVKTEDPDLQALLQQISKEFGQVAKKTGATDKGSPGQRAADLQKAWGTAQGQLWQLGGHRVLCGDCRDQAAVDRLFDGQKPDCIITDPPYCSGGFQEAGKKAGSIGTRGSDMIENDTLSTRGYTHLLQDMLQVAGVGLVYIFTDWRMWNTLFDIVESKGYGVKNMIVWDKGTPGMGRGWRSQHELIMAASKVTQPFDPHKAQGNVIACKRTGNELHPTEKPVSLLETILAVTDLANIFYDPFLGSGSTLAACEHAGKTCLGTEADPAYMAVILQRWLDSTGLQPVKL